MKFYKRSKKHFFSLKIFFNKLTSIYSKFPYEVQFFKNGILHNTKNAAISNYKNKEFYLNGKCYGNQYDFTKESWRKFSKLQAFL
jgi:hypothetical protein